jgi:hypothetical protein
MRIVVVFSQCCELCWLLIHDIKPTLSTSMDVDRTTEFRSTSDMFMDSTCVQIVMQAQIEFFGFQLLTPSSAYEVQRCSMLSKTLLLGELFIKSEHDGLFI